MLGLAFFPDGRRLVSAASDGTLRVWSVGRSGTSGGSRRLSPEAGPIHGVQVSPDGASFAAACQDGTVLLFDAAAGPLASYPAPRVLRGHRGPVKCLAYSPSGRWIVTGSDDLSVRFWHTPSARPAATWLVPNAPIALAFSPGGDTVAWSTWDTYELRTRRTTFPYRSTVQTRLHDGSITKLAHDARGRRFTASSDGTIKLWSASTAELAIAGGETGSGKVLALGVSRDGRGVISGHSDGRLRFWALAEPPHRAFINQGSQGSVFLRDRILATPSALFDLTGGIDDPRRVPLGPGEIGSLAVRAGSRWFAVGRDDGTLEVWDPDARRPLARWAGHAGRVVAMAGSPDGRLLATAPARGPVKVWEWTTGRPARTLDLGEAEWQALAWTPDGNELAAAGDGGVVVWDLRTGALSAPRRLVDRPQMGQILAIGRNLLAMIGDGGTVEIRDLHSGGLRHALSDRGGEVWRWRFPPTGGPSPWAAGALRSASGTPTPAPSSPNSASSSNRPTPTPSTSAPTVAVSPS